MSFLSGCPREPGDDLLDEKRGLVLRDGTTVGDGQSVIPPQRLSRTDRAPLRICGRHRVGTLSGFGTMVGRHGALTHPQDGGN